nr:amino acid adenylation domain-containing protein [Shimwellia pseudoproteus]
MLFSRFRQQVNQRPQALALIGSATGDDPDPLLAGHTRDQCWSYQQLDLLARRLAARLVPHSQPGDIIGIRLAKGPAQIVAVLAVLYAGCCYLPVGNDMPPARLALIRQRSRMGYLITGQDVSRLEQTPPLAALRSAPNSTTPEGTPDSLAYVIFTSGSTGEPKGVAVSHRAAANTINDVNARHQVHDGDVLLAVSSLDFDLSVYDIFGPLSAGGTIVTLGEAARRDAFYWAERVNEYRITLWNSVPALANMLLATEVPLASLRACLCSGDWIPRNMFQQLRQRAPQAILVAMGGSTEAAIWSNEYVIRDEQDLPPAWPSVPYWLPLSGQQYRVVREAADGQFIDCPDGVQGELWIGGAGLAEGYLGDAARTGARFIQAEGQRWYRTGDLGYWWDGLLFFVGRQDSQVKIQGHRIECGEIEQLLTGMAEISLAVVVPIRAQRALGALVVCRPGAVTEEQLRQRLAGALPYYMVPSLIRLVGQLPLTHNGKLDRQWASRQFDGPTAPAEAGAQAAIFPLCQQIWCQVLQRDSIEAGDNFFALGGDSIAVTRVCALLHEHGVACGVDTLFAAPELAQFARRCPAPAAPPASRPARHDPRQPFPLTALQRAYVLGAEGILGVRRCDTVFAVIIRNPQGYPLSQWQQALDTLIAETPGLRLLTSDTGQQVAEAAPVAVNHLADHQSLADYLSSAPLDARQSPPFLLAGSGTHPRDIGLISNYLTLDALSLSRVLLALIRRVSHPPSALPFTPDLAPFADYARRPVAPRQALSPGEMAAWQPPDLRAIIGGDSREGNREYSHVMALDCRLSAAQRRGLETLACQQQVTLTALVFHAYGQALAQLVGQAQVAVVVPVCWRPAGEEAALGQFTQLRLCRHRADDSLGESARALAEAVAGQTPGESDIAARGRAAYPFVFTSTAGVAEVAALYQGETRVVWSHTRTPGVIIDCQLLPDDDGLEIRWDYAAGAVDHKLLLAAHRHFTAGIAALCGSEVRPVQVASGQETLSGHQLAERAIAAALPHLDTDTPLAHFWRSRVSASPLDTWRQEGAFLVECVNGQRPPRDLLSHPQLAPEQLLLASFRQLKVFDTLLAALGEEAQRRGVTTLQVRVLGAGSGAFSQALQHTAAENNLSLRITGQENDDALNRLARRDPHHPAAADTGQPDVVIAPATLHRDLDLLRQLSQLRAGPPGRLPLAVHVLEVTAPDAASLVAAILDPSLTDPDTSPLRPAAEWGRQLEHCGAVLLAEQHLAANLVWLQARLPTGTGAVASEPPPVGEGDDTDTRVARSWGEVLSHPAPFLPTDDFFALGGDSLRATRIVTDLRRQGYPGLRLADLFNCPVFGEFVSRVRARQAAGRQGTPLEPGAPLPAVVTETGTTRFPLTALQKAYLAGRSADQLLGGVASHCYFEFSAAAPEGIDLARWQEAVSQVVARHDALRARVVWIDGQPWGQVEALSGQGAPAARVQITPHVRSMTEAETPDPRRDFPLRIRVSPQGDRIGIGMDNLMLDGMSMLLVLRELGTRYQGGATGQESALSWAHYRQAAVPHRPFDASMLRSMPPAPRLPYRQPLTQVQAMYFSRGGASIAASDWQAICGRAAQERLTPAALILAAYALELRGLAADPRFSINVTTFDRDSTIPKIASAVGDFTRLGLVAFGDESATPTADALLTTAREAHHGLLALHDTPEQVSTLAIAQQVVRRSGDPAAGLFPVVFTCGLGLAPATARSDDFGFGQLTRARSQTPQVTMDCQVHDDPRGLHITIDYVAALLPAALVNTLAEGIVRRLAALITRDTADQSNALAAKIAAIWRQYLPIEPHQPLDNFFQCGGDSLLATRCIRTLQTAIHPAISLRLLLTSPGFDDFCRQVEQLTLPSHPGDHRADGDTADFEEGTL